MCVSGSFLEIVAGPGNLEQGMKRQRFKVLAGFDYAGGFPFTRELNVLDPKDRKWILDIIRDSDV